MILFNFWHHVPLEEQERVLAETGSWNGIDRTVRFDPGDPTSDYYRVCVAYLTEDADAGSLLERLSALPEIEQAEVPASRGLL